MELWPALWQSLSALRPAFTRQKTFLWFTLTAIGMAIRTDMAGVTSVIRTLGLQERFYNNILDMFHSSAILLPKLTMLWRRIIVMALRPFIFVTNGRCVCIADGIKVAKAGKKMPAVKKLHQESDSNTKPEYIFGHSCQAIALLAGTTESMFAVPLSCRIHEGVIFSNRDKRTLLDKLASLMRELAFDLPVYMVADTYYASGRLMKSLLDAGHHLVTAVKRNAVAYQTAETDKIRKRGAPRKYGAKIHLKTLFELPETMIKISSPVYGEKNVNIKYRTVDLFWKRVGVVVRFVAVIHPQRGRKIFMSTDLSLSPMDIIRIYGLRFKIEVSFKQAIHTIGTYAYHFWMSDMMPLRKVSGNQHLHRKPEEYRKKVIRKIHAYHCHIMAGIVSHGIMQIAAITKTNSVWSSFGSWLRTIRPGTLPSERVTADALRNTLPEFLAVTENNVTFTKFIKNKIDLNRKEGLKFQT